jgi:Flp pilus assembly protein TadG
MKIKIPRKIAARLVRWMPARVACRFVREEDGATAVEFGLVALPFLALTFAIIETSLVFFAGQSLEAAVADASRQIMTGQAQNAGYTTSDTFKKNVVCEYLKTGVTMFDCNKVVVDVKNFASFSSIATSSPVTNGQLDDKKATFKATGPGCIQVVSFYYSWPIYVSLLGNNLSNLGEGTRLLVATAVFRNEPFGPTGTC